MTYGTPLHRAVHEVVADLGIAVSPSQLDRAAADVSPDEAAVPAEAAANLLADLGLIVQVVDRAAVPRLAQPGQVVLGVGTTRFAVVSHRSASRVIVTVLDDDRDGAPGRTTRRAVRRADLPARLAEVGGDATWLVVSAAGWLGTMAHPGGHLAPWRRLRAMLSIERREIGVVAVYAATLGALTLATPIAVQALVNTVAFGAILQPLIVLTVALAIGLGLAGVVAALQAYVVEVLQRRLLVRVAEDFGQRLPRVADAARDRTDLVELNNRFFDVITVQKASAELLLTGLTLVLQTVVGLMLLAFYHPVLLVFDLVLIGLLVVVLVLGRGATATAMVESKSKFALAAWLDEIARSPQRFAGGPAQRVAADELAHRAHGYVRARREHYRKVFTVLLGGIGLQVFAVVGLLTVGGMLVIDRQLTLGQLVAAEIVVGPIAYGFAKLGQLADKTFDLVAATDKIGKVLDLPLRRDGTQRLPSQTRGIHLVGRGVTAGYGTSTVASTPLDFDIQPGQKVLLDGPPGSGGSALLETIAGWRAVRGGRLSWDGQSAPRADDLLAAAAIVRPGDVVGGSVYTNLRLGRPGLSTDDAWEALRVVGLDRSVDKIGGLDRVLQPTGAPLANTKLARLALARAWVARPRLLVIDEALDHLSQDDDEIDALCRRFLGPDAPWTAIVISRDPRVRRHLPVTVRLGDAATVVPDPIAPPPGAEVAA